MSLIAPGTRPTRFRLRKNKRDEILDWEPNWKHPGISKFTFYRTYSRKKDNGKLETWNDCVLRVIEGMFTVQKTFAHQSHTEWNEIRAQALAYEAAERMFHFKWLPPGRGLFIMGTSFMWRAGGAALNNCAFTSTKDLENPDTFHEPFCFLMDASMMGVGVGFDTVGGDIGCEVKGYNEKVQPKVYRVPDSREGWVEVTKRTIQNAVKGKPRIKPDVSLVRKKGLPIKGFGGVASGPEPLIKGLMGIESILDEVSKRDDPKMTSVDITDIMNIIGKVVVAGNVRRTAEIAFGDPGDKDFMEMKSWEKHPVEVGSAAPDELKNVSKKDYKKYQEALMNGDTITIKEITEKYDKKDWSWKFGGWRWTSNNSLFVDVGDDYSKFEKSIDESGEPGFAWLDIMRSRSRMKDPVDNKDYRVDGMNPCGEQQLESGELCTLVENFPSHCDDYWDFQRTLKFSFLYAKTITLMGTQWEKTNSIIIRNRRIGCSISGAVDAIQKIGRTKFFHEYCDQGYSYLRYVDKKYSEWLGVPQSRKISTNKPSGTVSLVAGVFGPGIHFPKIRSGYRLIRVAADSQFIQLYEKAGYRVENSVTDSKNTKIIYFPWLTPEGLSSEEDVTIWEQFKMAADFQFWWSDNSVSCTVGFTQEESDNGEISKCLTAFDGELKGISLLKKINGIYPQMPFTNAPREEIFKYMKKLKEVDFSKLTTAGENSEANKFCDGESCEI